MTKPILKNLQEDQIKRLNALCHQVFGCTKEGKELMDLLINLYIVSRPVIGEIYKQMYGEHYVGVREGQNELIRELYNYSINDYATMFIKTEKEVKHD